LSALPFVFVCLHLSLQYKTLSQLRAHFFRQAKGRPQVAQVRLGKYDLFPLAAVME
jgi:hypothetical protein